MFFDLLYSSLYNYIHFRKEGFVIFLETGEI